MEKDKWWEGLACPPMDDYAYNFHDVNAFTTTSGGVYNLDPLVFFAESCQEQQDCNTPIIRKHGKGKEVKKVFQVMKPHMDPHAYEAAVKFAEAETGMEIDNSLKLQASKPNLRDMYGQINDSKKQMAIKIIEFQPPVPISKPTIHPTIKKSMPAIQKVKLKPTIQKPKPKTTWSSRLAKTVADICS